MTYTKRAVSEFHVLYNNTVNNCNFDIQSLRNNKDFIEICSNLTTAFYNAGVEEEFLLNIDKAWMNYDNAMITCFENLGPTSDLSQKIKDTIAKFKKDKYEYFKEKKRN